MSVFHAGNCVCEENNGCNECLPYFSLNPLPSSSCFFCPLHVLDITILIAVVNMEAQWNTWSWWQLVLLTPSPLGKSTEPVQGKKMQELLKRRAIKASHGACTAKLCKAVFGNTVFTASSVADVESVKMWMFIWLNEEVAKWCSLLHPTTWPVYFRHFCAAISRWMWMLKLSPLNLCAWQVMMMGRQNLHWLLCSKMKMRDG